MSDSCQTRVQSHVRWTPNSAENPSHLTLKTLSHCQLPDWYHHSDLPLFNGPADDSLCPLSHNFWKQSGHTSRNTGSMSGVPFSHFWLWTYRKLQNKVNLHHISIQAFVFWSEQVLICRVGCVCVCLSLVWSLTDSSVSMQLVPVYEGGAPSSDTSLSCYCGCSLIQRIQTFSCQTHSSLLNRPPTSSWWLKSQIELKTSG